MDGEGDIITAPETSGARPITEMESLVGVVDVGSNSVRLVIYDVSDHTIVPIVNDRVGAGLGRNLAQSGMLDEDGRRLALAAMDRFQDTLNTRHVSVVLTAATAAIREATDGRDFAEAAHQALGHEIRILPGEDEARLSALGVIAGEPRADGLVVDIGGSSVELALVHDGEVHGRLSLPLGVFALGQDDNPHAELSKDVKKLVSEAAGKLGIRGRPLYLVGGAWRSIARVDMNLRDYRLRILHGYRMSPARLRETRDYLLATEPGDVGKLPGVSRKRAPTLARAARLLDLLTDAFAPPFVEISSYGLREGMVYQYVSQFERLIDPTVSGFRAQARRAGADPTYRAALADVLEELASLWMPPEWMNQLDRFSESAACLAEIAIRQQPDYRSQSAFLLTLATSAVGLDHDERLFFAFAAARRHQRSPFRDHDDLALLLSPALMRRARILGALIRFLGEASGRVPEAIPALRYNPENLQLTADGEDRLSELSQKRLNQLREEVAAGS